MADETQAKTDQTAAATAAKAADETKFGITGDLVPKTRAEREAEKASKRAALELELKDLEPKATSVEDLGDEELHLAFFDELVMQLGSHPRLEALWKEQRRRIAPPAPDASLKVA